MEEQQEILNTGLRGVTIASTRISDVDGKAGRLIYRGYLVQDLAERASFEEVAYLLLYEQLPSSEQLEQFRSRLTAERHIPEEIVAALKTRPTDSLPMDILQAGVSMLANHDPDIRTQSKEAADRMAVRLIAQFPVLLAAWERVRTGKPVVAPRSELGHAANFGLGHETTRRGFPPCVDDGQFRRRYGHAVHGCPLGHAESELLDGGDGDHA